MVLTPGLRTILAEIVKFPVMVILPFPVKVGVPMPALLPIVKLPNACVFPIAFKVESSAAFIVRL